MSKILNQISHSFHNAMLLMLCIAGLAYSCAFSFDKSGLPNRLKITQCQVDMDFSGACESARSADETNQNIINFLTEISKASLYSSIVLFSLSIGFRRSEKDSEKS